MSVPSGTKFIGIASNVDTLERKSTLANSPSQVYTIEDIAESVEWGDITGTLSTQTDLQSALDAKQDDLISGTNIKTINGNSVLGSGDLVVGGITVGTTAVTSGTDGRVFFQQGGVVQQDANFTFNNTQKRLTLRASGTTVSDVPIRIRNSADTADLFSVTGNKAFNLADALTSDGFTTRLYSTTGVLQLTASGNGLNLTSNFSAILNATNDVSLQTNATTRVYLNNTGLVGIGNTSPAARLDVRAQGALSTDIAFRVRNSADTYNMSDVQGDSIFNFRVNNTATDSSTGLNLLGTNTNVIVNARSTNTSGSNRTGFLATGGGGYVGLFTDYGGSLGAAYAGVLQFQTVSTERMNFVNASNNCSGWAFLQTSSSTYALGNTVFAIYPTNNQAGGGTLALGTTLGTTISSYPAATYGKNTFFIANGTAPTTTGADAFGLYSADITAGNAAPHFRTENGSIIKLYQETTAVASSTLVGGGGTTLTDTDTFDGYTLKQIVKALRNQGILA